MGIYDRDYLRDPAPSRVTIRSAPVGGMNMWSVNTWLIGINVAVFLLDRLLAGAGIHYSILLGYDDLGTAIVQPYRMPLEGLGHFSVFMAIQHFQVWRFLTFQFLHANGEHIIFNMIALYFFGPIIEGFLGSRKYLAFYLICGIGGPLSYMALWGTHVLIGDSAEPLIGASAGIYGVLVAAAMIAPQATVLIYGIIPMKMRTMAWLMLAYAVYMVVTGGKNAGGEAAHLGGALVGFLLIKNPRVLYLFDRPRMRYQPRGL